MSVDDCGYDFIERYSDKEVKEFYNSWVNAARKYLSQSKPVAALEMIWHVAYYSGVLKERKVEHKIIDYAHITKDICDRLYEKLEKEVD